MEKIAIIMRSKNELPYAKYALEALSNQTYRNFNLYNVDSGSTDGTREVVSYFNKNIKDIPATSYVPGKVLNEMIKSCKEEIIVLLNADAIPQNNLWLEELTKPIISGLCDASFSRQIPRPDASFIVAYDYKRAYKKQDQNMAHQMFSAVSCAFKRSLWEKVNFYNEGYAEDLVWAVQCKRQGYNFRYVAGSVVEHSHNYFLKHLYTKKFRHGLVYFRLLKEKPSLIKQTYKFAKEAIRDTIQAAHHQRFMTIPYNILYRITIHYAVYKGEARASLQRGKEL